MRNTIHFLCSCNRRTNYLACATEKMANKKLNSHSTGPIVESLKLNAQA